MTTPSYYHPINEGCSRLIKIQTAQLVQQAIYEGRVIDAVSLLAQSIQQQEGILSLSPAQQALLQHNCHEVISDGPAVDPDLWEKVQACLYSALLLMA